MTTPSPRHRAPVDAPFDPLTDPRAIRAAYIADHGLRHLPAAIASHALVRFEVVP